MTAVSPGDLDIAELPAGDGFAPLLRALREQAGLTQEELAECSGLSIRAISDLERGWTSRPHRRSVALLAEALRIEGESLEKFWRLARRRTQPVRSLHQPGQPPPVAPEPAPVEPSPDGLGRLVEWVRQILVEEPARQARVPWPDPHAPRLVELVGAPGYGTTAVAVHAGSRLRQHFPDGQFYVDVAACASERTGLIGRLARVLGIAPADAAPGRLVSALRSRRALLVLDNVVDAATVRPILPTGSGCALIVIAPHRLALFDGVWTIDVPDLLNAR